MLRIFDSANFMATAVTAHHAHEIATIADAALKRATFVLYGRYENETYKDFTSYQKKRDTHVILGLAPKRLPLRE